MNFYIMSFDTETTGLSIYTAEVIQIGLVIHLWHVEGNKIQKNEMIGSFCEYVKCKSNEEFDIRVIDVTGITRSMVNDAKEFKIVVQNMMTYIENVCSNMEYPRVLITYNGDAYDVPVIMAELARNVPNPMEIIKKLKITCNVDILPCVRQCADTTKLKRNKVGRPSYRLGDVYASLLGENMNNAHNAAGDALGVLKCVEDIVDISYAVCQDLTSSSTSWKFARNIAELAKACLARYIAQNQKSNKTTLSLTDLLHDRKRKREHDNVENKKI